MMTEKVLQKQYNNVYSFFKNTSESFDFIEWDGKEAILFFNDKIIEKYSFEDLKEMGVPLL